MIETFEEIKKQAKSFWRFLVWFPRWRRLVKELVLLAEEGHELRSIRMETDAHICIIESELYHAKQRISHLERIVGEKDDALAHVGRFIAASHRISRVATPGTIKEVLQHAQRKN